MPEYKVRWSIDVSAGSRLEAAQRAQEIQRNPESIASFFEVKLFDSKHWKTVDLMDEKEIEKGYTPPPQPERGVWRK